MSLHPVQSAMVKHLGSQCGYCTPGIVMSLMEAYYRRDIKAPWQLDDQSLWKSYCADARAIAPYERHRITHQYGS